MTQRLYVTTDGHRLVLSGRPAGKRQDALLPVGDYKARVRKEGNIPNGAYWRTYEVLLKDGSTWDGYVFGESE